MTIRSGLIAIWCLFLAIGACAPEEVPVDVSPAATGVVGAYRTDAGRSGASNGAVGDDPRIVYRISGDDPVIASPVLADGRVFVPDGDGDLVAFRAESGEVAWRSPIGDADASVVVTIDSVYSVSSDAVVRRHGRADGDVIWETALDGSARSSPILADGRLLVVAGESLSVLDPGSGVRTASVDIEGRSDSSPAYTDGTVVLGTAENRIAFVDVDSLTARFVELPETDPSLTTYADGVPATPTIADGVVYIGSTSGWLVAATLGGEVLWEADVGSPIYGAVAIGPSLGFVPSAGGDLVAFDPTSGQIVWKAELGDAAYSSPVVAADDVVVTAENGLMFDFDAADGTRRWSIVIGEPGNFMASTPIVVGSTVIVGSNDGSIVGVATDR